MENLPPLAYSDDKIRGILSRVKTIALVGASANPDRPSYEVMAFLQSRGYRVIPVNPGLAGQELLGETVFAGLAEIPVPVDMVDVFRVSSAVPEIAEAAIAIGAKVLWTQLDVRHDGAAAKAEAAGIEVVMDRCPKIELQRLG
jgi:O-acetylhomoserine (thiol)-lyase